MIFSCEGALQSLSGSNISSVASVIEVPSTPTVMTSATFWKSSECQPDVLPAASQSRRALWEKTLCSTFLGGHMLLRVISPLWEQLTTDQSSPSTSNWESHFFTELLRAPRLCHVETNCCLIYYCSTQILLIKEAWPGRAAPHKKPTRGLNVNTEN